jgi:putative transposase
VRERCTIHRPAACWPRSPPALRRRSRPPTGRSSTTSRRQPGGTAVDEARRRAAASVARYERTYPAAVACLTSTLDELTVHLRLPVEHWQRIRHTNLLERTFGETRRRTKVIGRLADERSCLKLVWAALDRADLYPGRHPAAPRPPPRPLHITCHGGDHRARHDRRITCPPEPRPRFSTISGTRPS